jgi:trigger factor
MKGNVYMKTLDKHREDNILTATILIETAEFDAALKDAYQCSMEKFIIPGRQEGMALYDEALDICIPKLYGKFLRENGIVPYGHPEITDVSQPGAGPVTFTVQVPVMPKVSTDQYKGIAVRFRQVIRLHFLRR